MWKLDGTEVNIKSNGNEKKIANVCRFSELKKGEHFQRIDGATVYPDVYMKWFTGDTDPYCWDDVITVDSKHQRKGETWKMSDTHELVKKVSIAVI